MATKQPKAPAAFRKQVLALLGEGYGDRTLVLCPTVFVRLLHGDHKAAILLSQILYWGDRTKDPDGWFYKSYAEWQLETGLTEAQVRRIVNGDPRVGAPQITLRGLGVETLLRKVKRTGAPTLHYRLNQAQFLAVLQRFLGQGDPQQGAGSILDNGQDERLPMSDMNPDQSAPSSLDPQTITQNCTEDPAKESSERDEDFDIFSAYVDRFGKLKQRSGEALRAEVARLGAKRVGQVLERCASRGRSWNYVLRALANEGSELLQNTPDSARWEAFQSVERTQSAELPSAEQIEASERIYTPWHTFRGMNYTVQATWSSAYQQLELQFDRASFETWMRDLVLVDYDPERQVLIVVARTAVARELLQDRLYRTIQRIVRDVFLQPVEVQFVLQEDWLAAPTASTGITRVA